jgi:m7GpppX diphosphatase
LIFPCTQAHIDKYKPQTVRVVTESPEVYARHVRPHMQRLREAGRLNWVFNILDGREEQDDVLYHEHGGRDGRGPDDGFLVLPDLNWDRKTVTSLHLLGLPERRDLWSLRDLRREHVPWLQHMRAKLIAATVRMYPAVEEDMLKLYVHYQPTYYHFHVHVVHAALEAGVTQAVGKAFGLENLIEQLSNMDEGKGMADVSLTYTVGEAGELWKQIFLPLKEKRLDA